MNPTLSRGVDGGGGGGGLGLVICGMSRTDLRNTMPYTVQTHFLAGGGGGGGREAVIFQLVPLNLCLGM